MEASGHKPSNDSLELIKSEVVKCPLCDFTNVPE